jgi:hypothetical protein
MAMPSERQIIADFSAGLPLRPDAQRVRELLAAAFVAHVNELWPAGGACGDTGVDRGECRRVSGLKE